MRKEIQYQCEHCGRDVEYGSAEAVSNASYAVFCCKDCALEHHNLCEMQWDEWERVFYTPDENNGYGVCYMNNKMFTNGKYIVFDKCNLNIDEDEYEYFNARHIACYGVIDSKLEKWCAKANSTECEIKRDLSALPILWDKDKKKYIEFILKHSGNMSGRFLSSEPDEGGFVVINTNGVKAIMNVY